MKTITEHVNRAVRAASLLGSVVLIGIMLLTVAHVIARAFGSGITITIDVTSLGMVIPIALAFSYTALKQSHIAVELFQSRFPPRMRKPIDIGMQVLALVAMVILTWANIDLMRDRPYGSEAALITHIPYFPFRCVFVLGLVLFILVILVNLYASIRKSPEE